MVTQCSKGKLTILQPTMRYLCSLFVLIMLATTMPGQVSAQFYQEPEEVRKLKSINPLTRAKAIESIGEQGEEAKPQAVVQLGKILMDKYEDRANRLAALEAIRKVGKTRAEVLATDLRNVARMRDPEIKREALLTLKELDIPLVPARIHEATEQTQQAKEEENLSPAQMAMRNNKIRDALNLNAATPQKEEPKQAAPQTRKQPTQTAQKAPEKTPQELSVEEAARLVATSDKVTPEMVLAMFEGEGKPDPRYTSGGGSNLLFPRAKRRKIQQMQNRGTRK